MKLEFDFRDTDQSVYLWDGEDIQINSLFIAPVYDQDNNLVAVEHSLKFTTFPEKPLAE